MASISTSDGSSMPVKELLCDVFIIRHGPNMKHTLGRAIYKKLDVMGLKAFLNSDELEFGDQEVETAIKSAWLYIPVFSEDYFQSNRCLEELSFMRKRGTKIFPLFYHVNPEDLQSEKGVFADAFHQYKKNAGHTSEKLQEWKEAVYSVSHNIGPIVKSNEDEDVLLNDITDLVPKEGKKFASASTSDGSTTRVKEILYDVFINHRGPDVKSTLAIAIYKKLKDMGLKVFLDTEILRWGDHLPSVLEKATKSASLHIAIFSKNYARSQWCLRELSFMLQMGTRIIPIFYYVKPKDLRSAEGFYADAFKQYKMRGIYRLETLQEWKEALYKVSHIIGPIVNRKEDEDMLLKNIADCVAEEGKKLPFVVEEFASTYTSSSTSIGGSKMFVKKLHYDVFINYCGHGVKHTLGITIYKKLKDMGLNVFLDSEELRWGDQLPSVLEEVMKSASLHIVIFSESCAQSQCFLQEMSFIHEKGAMILPIFYQCEPAHVHHITRIYASAFDQHKEKGRYTSKKLQMWKNALKDVMNVSGCHCCIVNSKEDEDMLLKSTLNACKEFVNAKTNEEL
ncbi:hypothetical protein SUGI_0861450 [Cryptomeria japonica]|nr:hypothetical protein SUGI_0861450 [Cryptomeria japonica]